MTTTATVSAKKNTHIYKSDVLPDFSPLLLGGCARIAPLKNIQTLLSIILCDREQMFLLLPLLIVAWLLLLFFLCTAIEFHFVRAYLFCVRTFKCCFLNVHASCTLIRFDWIFWMVSVANFHTYRNTWTRPRFIINVLNLSHQFRSFFSLSRYDDFFWIFFFFSKHCCVLCKCTLNAQM